MPFTPSHAVVALAFVRTPLVPAAIAIGAMTPDLPLFVRTVVPGYGITHDARWLPVTMLWALVLLLAWRCLLRPAAGELAPAWLASRLPPAWDRGAAAGLRQAFGLRHGRVSVRAVAMLVVSLAIGVLTHIGWDLFTHEGRGGVAVVPALAAPWGPLPGYTWLQHGSSAAGLVVLGVVGAVWIGRRRPRPVLRMAPGAVRIGWWVSLPGILVLAWTLGLAQHGPLDDGFTAAHLAYRVLPPACAVWGAGTLAVCVVVGAMRAPGARDRSER